MNVPFRVCIGWDRREPEAYDVSAFSMPRQATAPVGIHLITLDDMQARQF
jgi:hypothetical protein